MTWTRVGALEMGRNGPAHMKTTKGKQNGEEGNKTEPS